MNLVAKTMLLIGSSGMFALLALPVFIAGLSDVDTNVKTAVFIGWSVIAGYVACSATGSFHTQLGAEKDA